MAFFLDTKFVVAQAAKKNLILTPAQARQFLKEHTKYFEDEANKFFADLVGERLEKLRLQRNIEESKKDADAIK